MEKAFTEREFQTNYDACFEKVSYKSLMGVQVFPGAAKQIINCVRSKQTPRKTPPQ